MIASIILILSAFYWLLIETDWLRVRLLVGPDNPASEWLLGLLPDMIADNDDIRDMRRQLTTKKSIDWYSEAYTPIVSWDWLKLHWHDLDDYVQKFELEAYGVRHSMIIKKPEIIKDVMKACKPSKQLKLKYKEEAEA